MFRAAIRQQLTALLFVFLPAGPAGAAVVDCIRDAAVMETGLTESVMSMVQGDHRRDPSLVQTEVARLEAEAGALDARLASRLLALGLSLREARRYPEAAYAFRRTTFVVRANEGLYSPRQIPIINLLIDSLSAAGRWQEVADAYDLTAWIYRRNFEPADAGQLAGLKRLHNWYVDAYSRDTGRTLDELFAASRRVRAQATAIIGQCGGDAALSACYLDGSCCIPGSIDDPCAQAGSPNENPGPVRGSKASGPHGIP